MIKKLFIVALLFVSTIALAQPGSIDPTFNTLDDGTLSDGTGFDGYVYSTAIQTDGKIIVGGSFGFFNGTDGINRVTRLNANGTRDTTFNTGTGFSFKVLSTSIQADGKIIVGGNFTSFNGTDGINRIVRLNTNGSRDATFNTGTGFNSGVYSTSIQADGKIIVGGNFTSFNSTNGINYLVRLNADGSRDTTFNTGTGFNSGVLSTSIQADGKIIVGGSFSSFNGTPGINGITRLNANGTRDSTFSTGTGFNSGVYSMSIQADGKIIMGGYLTSFNGTQEINNLVRLNADGSRDTAFNKGTGFNGGVYSTSIQADGKIIVGGNFTSFNGTDGINRIARLNADGSRDSTLNMGTGFNSNVNSTSIQADGKMIVGGYFTAFNSTPGINYLLRLNADGSRDGTFNEGTGFNGMVQSTSIQADGKIIVVGIFTSFNNKKGLNHIARLNADGSRDTTFNTGTGFNSDVLSTAIQADGKIIVGGVFTSFNGTPEINNIVRLNADGSRDGTFNEGTGFYYYVSSIAIQADGKIIVGGYLKNSNRRLRTSRIVRLNADGSRDTTFNTDTGFYYYVRSIAIQADGKIIVEGGVKHFNSTHIVRLNADGSRDTTFNIGTGFNGNVNSISIQADGKIIVGGIFNSFNNTNGINHIVRLNANGSLDTTFNTVTWFNADVNSISIQSDGKIIVGGNFTYFDGKGKNRLVRLLLGCTLILTTSVNGVTITANETGATYQWIDCNNANAPIIGETNQSFIATANGNYAVIVTKSTCSDTSACVTITKVGVNKIEALHTNFQVFPNPNNGTFSLQTNYSALGKISITNALGELVFSEIIKAPKAEINLSAFSSGVYFIEATTNGFIGRQKIVISK